MIESITWSASMLLLPLVVASISYSRIQVEQLRLVATSVAALMSVIALVPVVEPTVLAYRWAPGIANLPHWTSALIRVNSFSVALHIIPPTLWLLAVAVTPRLQLDRQGLRRTALATATTSAAFLTEHPLLLVIFWVISLLLLRGALQSADHHHARRVATAYLTVASFAFAAGLCLVMFHRDDSTWWMIGVVLMVAGALIRKGIFPFHAWVPEVFDRGRLGPAILFCAPQLGSYVTVVLIVPIAGPGVLKTVTILALITAVYGAALALVQSEARRACGYLFASQSALVMAGLYGQSDQALAGSLVLWLSSSLSFAAFSRCVLVLEGRRGRLDLNRYHGGYARMPMLAATFLLTGLACSGFPGTLGFVGEEMLVHGAVSEFPILGFLGIIAGAFTGLAVLRMYFSLFCGKPSGPVRLSLLRREKLTFAAVVIALVATGLVPGPLVNSRLAASKEIHRTRNKTIHHLGVRAGDFKEICSGVLIETHDANGGVTTMPPILAEAGGVECAVGMRCHISESSRRPIGPGSLSSPISATICPLGLNSINVIPPQRWNSFVGGISSRADPMFRPLKLQTSTTPSPWAKVL